MRPRGRILLCCVVASLGISVLAVGGSSATAAGSPPAGAAPRTIASLPFWVDPSTAAAGTSLNAVAAVAPDDVWAVGASYDGRHATPLTQHWDGVTWTSVPGPEIRGVLTAISAVGPNDV